MRPRAGSSAYLRKRAMPFLPADPTADPRPYKARRILPYLGGDGVPYRVLPDVEVADSVPADVPPDSDEPAACGPSMEEASLPVPVRDKPPLHGLGVEIVIMILEELRELDPIQVARIRLVSHLFDDLAAPIFYRDITISWRLAAPVADMIHPRALQNVHAYTKHATVPSNLLPEAVSKVLGGVKRLASMTWQYVRHAPCWMPDDYLKLLQPPHDLQVCVERLPVQFIPETSWDSYSIPVDKLVSLKMWEPLALQPRRLYPLKDLILRARGLQTFHYEDGGQGRQFFFDAGERFPPFRELRLRCYDWQHTTEEVDDHWDFSQIRTLELSSVPLYRFLTSVSPIDLAFLETLHAEDAAAWVSEGQRRGATDNLYIVVRDYIRALTTLRIIGCHLRRFSLDAVLAHAKTLESFCIRDYVGFEEDGRRCPTLAVDEVRCLAANLVHLRTLELDMDIPAQDALPFLEALCTFPQLHTLTLHIQTVLRPLSSSPGAAARSRRGDEDPDHDAALTTFHFLLSRKGGWRSVTLKVGGWRRIGVRRLGQAWRQMNARGRYAERCFVMDRDDLGNVQVREEDMMTEPEVVRNALAAA